MASSADLTIEDCTFGLPGPGQANVFGAAIFATGTMDGTTITGCTFQSADPPAAVPFNELAVTQVVNNQVGAPPPYQLTFGYLQVPGASAGATVVHDAVIEQNLFLGVTVPALVMAQLGTLRLDRNTARGAYGGFWLVSLANPAQQNVIFGQFSVGDPNLYSEFASVGIAALRDGIFVIATAIGQVLPAAPPSGGSRGRQHRCAEHGPGGARRPDGHRLLLAGDRGCVRRAAATRDRRRLGEPGGRTADRTRGACGGHGHERDLAARCVRLPGRRDDRRLLFRRRPHRGGLHG